MTRCTDCCCDKHCCGCGTKTLTRRTVPLTHETSDGGWPGPFGEEREALRLTWELVTAEAAHAGSGFIRHPSVMVLPDALLQCRRDASRTSRWYSTCNSASLMAASLASTEMGPASRPVTSWLVRRRHRSGKRRSKKTMAAFQFRSPAARTVATAAASLAADASSRDCTNWW